MIRVNGTWRSVAATGLEEALRELGYDPERAGMAVAVNGEVVSRQAWAGTSLGSGDEIEVVEAVQGG